MDKKIIFALLFTGFMLLNIFVLDSQSNYKSKSNKVSNEVIKDFNSGNDSVKVIIKVKDISSNQRTSAMLGISNENDKRIYRNYIQKEVTLKELNELQNDGNVERILKSHNIHAFLQDSVTIVNSTITNNLRVNGFNITGKGQTVCIIDTGIDCTHADLVGRNQSCVIVCINKVCVENCSIGDNNGHGTHIAGIVGANGGIKGIAPNVSFIGIKVLDSNGDGSGNSLDLSRAIDYCTNRSVSVISMSLGTSEVYSNDCGSQMPWTDSINSAFTNNITILAATGNSGSTTGIASPACIGNVTPVGRTNKDDSIASSGNRNSLLSLVAPGTSINSTKAASTTIAGCSDSGNYRTCSGTSMSTPMVAGAVILMYEFLNRSGYNINITQIESKLNSTGKQISDSSTGLTFTRINVYNAVISLDSTNPIVNLISPTTNNLSYSGNLSFRCNVSDNLLLKNITLNIWNSSSVLYYNESSSLTNNFTDITFNITNISNGNYNRNCYSYDNNSNFASASQNFSFFIGNITTNINSPSNNSFRNANTNQTNFSCLSQTASIFNLANITFGLYNATNNSLVYNQTKNISGTTNTSTFNYNFSIENNYYWNCNSYNNLSQNSLTDNYTVYYDITNPNVTLILPDNSASYNSNSQTINFSFNVTDNFGIANCSLLINNATNSTNTSIITNQTNNISQTFSPSTYYWRINCSDNASNYFNSSERTFTITAPAIEDNNDGGGSSGGGGSGSGTGGTSSLSYKINENEIKTSYTKELKINDKIIFSLTGEKLYSHNLTVKNITNNNLVNIIVQSEPITINLLLGETKKLNLTSIYYNDLSVKLNSITNNKANITIKEINETKSIDIIMFENETENINETGEVYNQPLESNKFNIPKWIFYLIIGIFIIFLIVLYHKNKNRKNNKKK